MSDNVEKHNPKLLPPDKRPYRQMHEPGDELTCYYEQGEKKFREILRQVGWQGQTGAFYSLDEKPMKYEPGSYAPLYAIIHHERVEEDDLDDEGYPTDSILHRIATWPMEDSHNLPAFLKPLWHFGDWGWEEEDQILSLSTGGWSGNEDMIGALQQSIFWTLAWEESRRGGHYKFDLGRVKVLGDEVNE